MPADGAGTPAVLVLRALGLGDLLTAVPALRGLRRALPGRRTLLATDPALRELVELVGAVDAVVPARGLGPLSYDGPPPEIAVNLHGKGPQSHRLLREAGAGRLVAFGCVEAAVEGPLWRRDEHEVDRWCRLLNETFGPVADPADLRLPSPEGRAVAAARPPGVVLHPGAAQAARRWPVDRFASVAASLAGRGHRLWITGSPPERGLAEQVAARAGVGSSAVVAGETSLSELAVLVAQAPLVVCGDTGTAHLATAFGTPSVVLFGPTPPAWWGPPAHGPHVALWHGTDAGDPWAAEPDPALLEISVEEVAGAAESLLGVRRA